MTKRREIYIAQHFGDTSKVLWTLHRGHHLNKQTTEVSKNFELEENKFIKLYNNSERIIMIIKINGSKISNMSVKLISSRLSISRSELAR